MTNRLLFAISTLLLFSVAACKSEPNPEASVPETIRNVAVVKAESTQIPDSIPALGTVRATQTAQLSAQIMGSVTRIDVREGDPVKQGQVLVEIDAAQAQAGLDRAQAALSGAQHELLAARTQRDLAASTLKRYSALYERKSVSPQEFDEVRAQQSAASARAEAAQDAVTQAKATVGQAQTAFNYTRIRAPFNGIVTARLVDPGAMAAPGTPLMTVESRGRYRAEVTVDESSLNLVKIGHDIPVSLDAYPDESFNGKVIQVFPSADALSRTFLVKIELPESATLRSGLSARANFSRGTRDIVVLPTSAVVDRGAMKAVYVVNPDHTTTLRYVTVGAAQQNHFEILSGVAAYETVVASPSDREFAGKKIEVQ